MPYGEIMTVYERMGDSIGEQIRVVDFGGDINVAVGILRRVGTRTEGELVEGNGFPFTVSAVRELIGPSGSRRVVNGMTRTVGAGDVVVIPVGVSHRFRHIQDQVTYLSIRVDPNQTLPVGYAHPSLSE